MSINKLFDCKLTIINIGLRTFAEGVSEQGVKVLQIEWRPPVNKTMSKLLGKVL